MQIVTHPIYSDLVAQAAKTIEHHIDPEKGDVHFHPLARDVARAFGHLEWASDPHHEVHDAVREAARARMPAKAA